MLARGSNPGLMARARGNPGLMARGNPSLMAGARCWLGVIQV